jgi:predicted N-acetyltransferase YhbS
MSFVYVVRRLVDDKVAGYFAVANGSVLQANAPARVKQGSGGYPIPVVVLARLGVDVSEEGRGLGTALVKEAFKLAIAAASSIGVRAVLIHAENAGVKDWYRKIAEFEESPTDPLHLVVMMKDLKKAVGA